MVTFPDNKIKYYQTLGDCSNDLSFTRQTIGNYFRGQKHGELIDDGYKFKIIDVDFDKIMKIYFS